jgi:hypothetical protein
MPAEIHRGRLIDDIQLVVRSWPHLKHLFGTR